MGRLDGKRALVTGGSRGIGRAVALRLAEEGADVAVNYRSGEAEAESVAEEARSLGGAAVALQASVADAAQADALIAAAIDALGGLDILVNNAGITRDGLLLRMSEEDWDAVLDTNLKGAFLCTRAAARPMARQRSGRIINMASVVALTGNPGQANYAAAKAGLIGFTKTVARELATRGVTANAIAPGFITTQMTEGLSAETQERIRERIPLGGFGAPEDVAACAAFLASDDARYITGQVLGVDGGLGL